MQFTVQCDAVSNVLLQLGMAIKRKKCLCWLIAAWVLCVFAAYDRAHIIHITANYYFPIHLPSLEFSARHGARSKRSSSLTKWKEAQHKYHIYYQLHT